MVCMFLVVAQVFAQESDLEVKKNFEAACADIKMSIDVAERVSTLDSLAVVINALETRYRSRQSFLDKALYPVTFADRIRQLREQYALTYDRMIMIESQGTTILEYEARISLLSNTIDSLTEHQRSLYTELQSLKKATATMRATIKQLTNSIQMKDRLIFALVDTIFLPYDKNLNQVSDVQKEAVNRKLLKANVVARVYDIAADNLKFLEVTQLQGKDFANLVDQYEQFNTKWSGLRDKISAVSTIIDGSQASGAANKKTASPAQTVSPGVYVDSAMILWRSRLHGAFWNGVQQEFTSRGIALQQFSDAQTFSASIRAYVDSAIVDGRDASVFVNEVWKERIDKEWRDAMTKENILGAAEYANLDKLVSTLGGKKIDPTFIAYAAAFLVVVAAIWWFVGRKPKTA